MLIRTPTIGENLGQSIGSLALLSARMSGTAQQMELQAYVKLHRSAPTLVSHCVLLCSEVRYVSGDAGLDHTDQTSVLTFSNPTGFVPADAAADLNQTIIVGSPDPSVVCVSMSYDCVMIAWSS